MREFGLFTIIFLLLMCSKSPTNQSNDFIPIDKIEVSIEMDTTTYFSDYHVIIPIYITNQSEDSIYLNKSNLQIQKFIDNQWIGNPPSSDDYEYTVAIGPSEVRESGIVVSFLNFFNIINGGTINGEYRSIFLICNQPIIGAPCPEDIAKEKVLSDTFILKERDIPYSRIDSRIPEISNSIFISDTVLSFSNDEEITTTITNNSPFNLYLNSTVVHFQRSVDNNWVSGINGIQGYWFVIDSSPERLILDPGETFERLGKSPVSLDLSRLNNTTGQYRFNYQLCLDPYEYGYCTSPVPEEYKVSKTFEVTE